jgi:hypothetical protein
VDLIDDSVAVPEGIGLEGKGLRHRGDWRKAATDVPNPGGDLV